MEMDTRMYAKSTSKGEFFDSNREMSLELARKEFEEELASKKDEKVREIDRRTRLFFILYISTCTSFSLASVCTTLYDARARVMSCTDVLTFHHCTTLTTVCILAQK
jgi:hypothetical protein